MLTGLADALRAGGLTVEGVDGWRERGHGPMTDVRGVTCHHTAGLSALSVVRDGRPGLDGPLAHLYLDRQGVFHVVAAGLCWHAGVSRKPAYTNSHRIGIEAEALGTGAASDWPDAQMDAYRRGCRALAEHYGFGIDQVLGHKETCAPVGRKTDPSFDMAAFRRQIIALEDDVPLTDRDLDAIATRVLRLDAIAAPADVATKDNATWQLQSYVKRIEAQTRAARADTLALRAQVTALAAAVQSQSADGVRQAIADGIRDLEALRLTLTPAPEAGDQ